MPPSSPRTSWFSNKPPAFYTAVWATLSVIVLALDYVTGPTIQFPILFIIPIGIAAYYSTLRTSIFLALILVLTRFYFALLGDTHGSVTDAAVNLAIRIVVLVGYAIMLARIRQQNNALQHKVHLLEGILPICSFCKKIRDDDSQWHSLESYISDHSEATFSHTFCPECREKHYGAQLRAYKESKGGG